MAILQAVRATVPLIAIAAALLLVPAGLAANAWAWPSGWAFLAAMTMVTLGGSATLATVRPASFAVRQQGLVADKARRQPWIDAAGSIVYAVCQAAWLAFIPIDVFRLHLLPAPSGWVSAGGAAAVIGGTVTAYVAIGQNRFAAPTIHDQSAEGQHVIQTGLYGLVRHPFYAGMLLAYAGAALWLGSYAAALVTTVFLLMTLARIVIEERWLREHLPDYAAYARRVRGRLIPYLL
jgi:protein-S-isoprenylcysteine O-methyltransferase Ste14